MSKNLRSILMVSVMAVTVSIPVAHADPVSISGMNGQKAQNMLQEKQMGFYHHVSAEKETSAAKDFVDNLGKDVIALISRSDMSESARKDAFSELLGRYFDMRTIGIFALGPHWRSASDTQKTEYLDLFEKMIVEVYSRRFDEYSGQVFKVEDGRADGNGKDFIINSMVSAKTGPAIRVDWRVRKKGKDLKVIDVIVEGVSMSVTQRSDFNAVIRRGGGELTALLDHLKTI